jgi:transcriptional regulator with XRE-family HTH domain
VDLQGIGQRIRQRREARDLTLEDLAREVDLTQSRLAQIERGRSFMRVEQLVAMARALRCPVGYLLGELPHPEGGWLAESGGKG